MAGDQHPELSQLNGPRRADNQPRRPCVGTAIEFADSFMRDRPTLPTVASRGRPRDPARVQRVIEAAQRSFLLDGYERTSVDAIARDSGVSKVTIYSYFPTKRALYAAAMHPVAPKEQPQRFWHDLSPATPRESLTLAGRRFLKFQRDEAVLRKHRTIYAEAIEQPEVARAFYASGPQRKMGELAAFLKACQAAKTLDITDPELAAEQFLCLFFGRGHLKAVLGLGKPSAAADATLVRKSVDFFLRAYARRR